MFYAIKEGDYMTKLNKCQRCPDGEYEEIINRCSMCDHVKDSINFHAIDKLWRSQNA